MACGSDESAQTGAEGGIHAEGEGTQRRITHHIAVTVNGLFRGWRAILQVIPTVQLAHVGAFHERVAAAKKDVVQRLLKLRTILFLFAWEVETLKAMAILVPIDEGFAFADGRHGGGIQLGAIDGTVVGTAPVQVHPAVIIRENRRIPEIKGCADLLKLVGQRILRPPDGAGFALAGRAEIQIVADLPCVRSIQVHIQIAVLMPLPAGKIVGIVEACAHAGEQVIGALEEDQRRIGSLPVGGFAVVLEFVRQIKRIAEFHKQVPF